MKPLLVVTLSNHWSIKNIVHSGAAKRLQEHFILQFWTEESRFEPLREVLDHFGVSAELRRLPGEAESRMATAWRLIQKSVLYERHRLLTERIAQKSHRGRRNRLSKLLAPLGRLVARSPFGNWVFAWATQRRRAAVPPNRVDFGVKPAGVLIANPFDFREDPVSAAAFSSGCRVIAMIPSWDNLTSKGVIDSRYHSVLVWNEAMADELIRLYPEFSRDRAIVTGLPRMDAFDTLDSPEGEWVQKLGLVAWPRPKLILFANTATKSYPQQPQVIHHVVNALQEGAFGDARLLIRCHPHDDPDQYADFRARANVAVWPCGGDAEAAFGVKGCPPPSDLSVLSAMILSADVVVNAASTIALDAAYCDKPIVSVAYDGDERPKYEDSIRSAYDYEHQKPYLMSNAGVMCSCKEDLICAIQSALDDPKQRRAERASLGSLISPGNAVDRLVSAVLKGTMG